MLEDPCEGDAIDASHGLHFEVDGFRSLQEFKIDLRPGLNVLVGPNGSGKSNFIEFLDFLYVLTRGGASQATSSAGGISRVFSQESLRQKTPKIVVSVSGISSLSEYRRGSPLSGYFRFEYKLEIRFSKRRSSVYISSESIRFGRMKLDVANASRSTFIGTVSMSRQVIEDDFSIKWEVSPRLLVDKPNNPLVFNESTMAKRNITDHITRLLDQYDAFSIEPDRSIFSEFSSRALPAMHAVRLAATRGRSYNIMPAQVRKLDDISRPAVIDRDGSGLSSTLYELQSLRNGRVSRTLSSSLSDEETMGSLIRWTKLVYPALSDIRVNADLHLGKYVPYLWIGPDTALKIPFASTSDGTLRWLCLVTLILSSGGTYTIEEPENYLHPKMQQFLVQLVRDELEDKEETPIIIMSTHSETLINQCRPSELVVFSYRSKRTSATRPDNVEALENEIERTGFGLGHYYVTNSVS